MVDDIGNVIIIEYDFVLIKIKDVVEIVIGKELCIGVVM